MNISMSSVRAAPNFQRPNQGQKEAAGVQELASGGLQAQLIRSDAKLSESEKEAKLRPLMAQGKELQALSQASDEKKTRADLLASAEVDTPDDAGQSPVSADGDDSADAVELSDGEQGEDTQTGGASFPSTTYESLATQDAGRDNDAQKGQYVDVRA
ncbi:hypothetical protein [Roseateles noduli]|uniref:hypothetical protein n=1 Tax=Roseateles noduli TaxID=2052484 RepID=UPI003D64AA47